MVHYKNTQLAFQTLSRLDLIKRNLILSSLKYKIIIQLMSFIIKFYALLSWILKPLIKSTLYQILVGGETLIVTKKAIDNLQGKNILTILDYASEDKNDPLLCEKSKFKFLQSLDFASQNPSIPYISIKLTSLLSGTIFTKIQSHEPLSNKEQDWVLRAKANFNEIVEYAYNKKISVLVDAEESWLQDPIDLWTIETAKKYNKDFPCVYFTVQLYRKDRLDWMKNIFSEAQKENYIPAFKIVRGAYIEKENQRAIKYNYECPLCPDKKSTDSLFRKGLEFCLLNCSKLFVLIGTHNEDDVYFATNYMKENIDAHDLLKRIHFSQLYGMRDTITYQLALDNISVSKYLPYGQVKEVLPYLIRRAIENSSLSGQASEEAQLVKEEIKRRKKN